MIGDVNAFIIYKDVLGHALNFITYIKRTVSIPDVFPYDGIRWQTYGLVTAGITLRKMNLDSNFGLVKFNPL